MGQEKESGLKGAQAVVVDLTPELKVKLRIVCDVFMASCKAQNLSPPETFCAITFLRETLLESMGVKVSAVHIVKDSDIGGAA